MTAHIEQLFKAGEKCGAQAGMRGHSNYALWEAVCGPRDISSCSYREPTHCYLQVVKTPCMASLAHTCHHPKFTCGEIEEKGHGAGVKVYH